MGASDRYLANATIADLRTQEGGTAGYVSFFKHGVIGKGLNDYDAIFNSLKGVGFTGWVSIEDGVDGMAQMIESANFLKAKINQIWG
jgi:sugar phosphate isomerase/epimerase